MTIGKLWDPDLVGDGVLVASEASKASERKAQAIGVQNKVQIGRGGWKVLKVIVE